MGLNKTSDRRQLHWAIFFISVTLVLLFYGLYVFNMVQWRNSADFGWIPMFDFGPNVVAEVFEAGEKAGLREGDEIREINGQPYTTFYELFFEVRNHEPGSTNTYLVEQDGNPSALLLSQQEENFRIWEMLQKNSGVPSK